MVLRRARGVILRLVRRRKVALLAGAVLVAFAAWLQFGGQYEVWWAEGLSLVLGATGAAIVWTALTGARPDWIDRSDASQSPKPKAKRRGL